MDQDSTNGTSSDKRKWRERLGIGTKDMPKISDEFKTQPAETPPARAPQPVIKLAPMAPRPQSQQPGGSTPVNRDVRRGLENPESLAEKLRAQRAAAEMLAVQRVSAARQRAEARAAGPHLPAHRGRPHEPQSKDTNEAVPRPKFSFADDGQPGARREPGLAPAKAGNGAQQKTSSGASSVASLVPPRPALGGERPHPSLARHGGTPYRPDAPSAFRPIDPAAGYATPSSRTPPFGGQRSYSHEPGALPHGRNLTRKPAHEPFRRNQDVAPYGAENRGESWRGDPRLGRSLAGRSQGRPVENEFDDDVFEDEAPERRAGASDYRTAYREVEEGEVDDRRRSNGPWLLLLALLVAAFATGGVIWLYNSNTPTTASTSTTETVPVIAAPEEPAKTAAEKPADDANNLAAVGRKQIYDRIVGDQEITGDKVVPTEVTPIQPEAEAETSESETGAIPQPTGTKEQGADDMEPLPLPPAPGEKTEGAIDQGTDQKVVATASQSAGEEVKTQTASQSSDSIASLLPATGAEEESTLPKTTPAISDTTSSGSTSTASSSSAPTDSGSTAVTEPETQLPLPVEKKATVAKKKPATDSSSSLGAEPVVIVPPGDIISPSQETVESGTLSVSDTATSQPPVKRKRTLFDLFSGNKAGASEDTAVVRQPATTEPAPQKPAAAKTKVASLPAETVKTSPEKQSGGSGYVVQLASFRTQDEAQAEYARLRSKYPSIIGTLPSSIVQATVAGSIRHRLGLGPLATRDQASQICSSLIAGGERDCLVRKQ